MRRCLERRHKVTMAASPYEQLEQEFRRLHAFRGALSLLRWDAAVMMPRGSADVRGEQLAALETEHHALLTRRKWRACWSAPRRAPPSWRIGRSPICTRCAASATMRLRPRPR